MISQLTPSTDQLRVKDSILDVARLQQYYNPSDETLWAFFNLRVLLNQPIGVDEFMLETVLSDEPYGQFPVATVG